MADINPNRMKKYGNIFVPLKFNTAEAEAAAKENARRLEEHAKKQAEMIDRILKKFLAAVLPAPIVYLMAEHSHTPGGPKNNARLLHHLRIETKVGSFPYATNEGEAVGTLRWFRMFLLPKVKQDVPILIGELKIIPVNDKTGPHLNFTSKVNASVETYAPSHPSIINWLRGVRTGLSEEILRFCLDEEHMRKLEKQFAPLYALNAQIPPETLPAQENAPETNVERKNDGPVEGHSTGSEP